MHQHYMDKASNISAQNRPMASLPSVIILEVSGVDKSKMNGKCPKILYTEVSDKIAYANSADPDQTAPEVAVSDRGLHCLPFH